MVNRSVIDRIAFLRALSARAKDDLAARAVTRRFTRGRHLWRTGDEPRGLFVILAGHVRIVGAKGSRQHAIHSEGPGATIGEIPLFAGGTYPASAIASGDVECLVIDRATLTSAMRADPELAFALLGRLAGRIRHLLERLSAQTADPVGARLAGYLLERPAAADGTIVLGGTQRHVAEDIGTVREVVVRLLRRLAADRVIAPRGRGRYAVLDRERLQAEAQGAAT